MPVCNFRSELTEQLSRLGRMFDLKSGTFEENNDLGIPWLLRELVCQFKTIYIFFGLILILTGLILFSDVKKH